MTKDTPGTPPTIPHSVRGERSALSARPARWEDVDEIHALTQLAYAEYNGTATPSTATAETRREIREKFWTGALRAVVVESEAGTVVGAARYRADSDGLYFFRLCVHPEFRRQGIARLLLEFLEATARQERTGRLWCQVRRIVPRNVALYENAGFVAVAEHTVIRNGNPVPVVTMEKRLD